MYARKVGVPSIGNSSLTEVAINFSHFLSLLIDDTGSYDCAIAPGCTIEDLDSLLVLHQWKKESSSFGFIHNYKNVKLNTSLQVVANRYSDGSGYSRPEYPQSPFIISMVVGKRYSQEAVKHLSSILGDAALNIHSPHPYLELVSVF